MSASKPVNLTTEELAERLRTTVEAIHMMNSRGIAPPRFRRGTRVLYRIADVEAWEASRIVQPARMRRAQAA